MGPPVRRVVVAIDGPAGSGKSTLAVRLAAHLDLPYVNTGLMYRALTASALGRKVGLEDGPRLADLAADLRFDLDWNLTPPGLTIDGGAPGEELVAPDVEEAVSAVSSRPAVRAVMAEAQRRLGSEGAVMEGRDIGSVIFPDADVKLFLEAPPDERRLRRHLERGDRAADDVADRDELDSRVNPFVPAPGAVSIDTTGRSADEVFEAALAAVLERLERDRA